MGIFDGFLKPIARLMRQPVESFIRLETADDEWSFVSSDGSLVSVLRVDGSRQLIGDDEYRALLNDTIIKLGMRFNAAGHAMQVYFCRNPDRAFPEVKKMLRPNARAAAAAGLDINDIFEERSRHLGRYLAWEEIYFVLWTRPAILSKADMQRENERARKKKWVRAEDAQYPFAAMDALRNRHRSFLSGVHTSLSEMGIQNRRLEVHEALSIIRAHLLQTSPDTKWRAVLPGDKVAPRAITSKQDMSEILWPTLRQQLTMASARVINDHVVEMGKYVWGGCDLVLAPSDPLPFPMLLDRLIEANMPFRVSYLIEGGGAQGMAMQAFLASIFSVTNSENKQVSDALEALEALSKSEPIVKMRVSFATWAPRDDIELLEDRLSVLTQAVESWGFCQVSMVSGDPLEQVLSSAVGIHCASTAPAAIAPLYEVMKLMPWQRSSSPFASGSILFRTPDGRVWPYQTGSNLTTTWFDLIFALPGGGKSVLMNTLNLGTCLTAGATSLPYIAVIDIGPSSGGLISLLRDALPPEQRHLAVTYRLQMSQQYAINPFDTKLGMRRPQISERSFLVELLTLLSTPPGQEDPYDGVAMLAGMVVDEMYRWRDDGQANAEPRPYLPRIDAAIDEAIRQHNVALPDGAYWWDVVDALFDKGLTQEAGLAQRYAMPTLGDAVAAARRPQIRNLLEETSIGVSTESVIHAFERMITSAVREFPILSTVTRFALSENRICALDLADVCPSGGADSDRQTAVMYMLARNALVTPWWINEEAIAMMPEKYRAYHEARLRDIAETPKRLCYDEFHRTSKTKAVRQQIVRDVREGRKRGIQIVLASQMLEDFDDDMIDLATGVWILGKAVSENAINLAQERFGLTDTARWIMKHRITGPGPGGAPCLLVLGTTEGKYEQHLINTLGPIELWAFSTTAEDVAIRSRLYTRLGAARARRLLGANFPGGSARSEIRRRIMSKAEKEGEEAPSVGDVIEELVEELVASTKVQVTIDQDEPQKPQGPLIEIATAENRAARAAADAAAETVTETATATDAADDTAGDATGDAGGNVDSAAGTGVPAAMAPVQTSPAPQPDPATPPVYKPIPAAPAEEPPVAPPATPDDKPSGLSLETPDTPPDENA